VFGGHVQSAVVPPDVDLVGLEARHVDAEDEGVLLLVEFEALVAPVRSERAGREAEVARPRS
jgi:hypothetical protein